MISRNEPTLPTQSAVSTQSLQYLPQQTGGDQSWLMTLLLFLAAGVAVPAALAYTFAVGDEIQVTAVVLGLAAVVLTLARPFWGLIIFVGLLYTRPEEVIPALKGMHFSLIASLVTLIGTFLQKVMDKDAPVRTPLNGMILGFGAVVIASAFNAADTSEGIQDISKLVILVLLTLNLVRTPERFRTLAGAIIFFTTYLACYSAFRYFQGDALVRTDGGTTNILQSQGTGIFGDPNDLSATIVAGLGLLMAEIFRRKAWQRLLLVCLGGFMVWGTFLTNSRGGILALAGVIAAGVMTFARSKATSLILAVVLILVVVRFGSSRMTQLSASEESANTRLWFWDNGVKQVRDNPLAGVGYGQFHTINSGMTAHNSFVLCFGELGLPGYFCWMGCLYYCFRRFSRPLVRVPGQPPPEAFYTRKGAQLALGGFLMAAFWISRTYVPILYLLISLPVAQEVAYSGGESQFRVPVAEKMRDWFWIGFICLTSIAVIGFIAGRYK